MPDFINDIQAESKTLSEKLNIESLSDKDKLRLQTLLGWKLDQTKEYLPPEPLLFCNNLPFFHRKEFTLLTGKSKCRKSFFLTCVMSAISGTENIKFSTRKQTPLKIMYFDTEQAEFRVNLIKQRINVLCGRKRNVVNNNIEYFAVSEQNSVNKDAKNMQIDDVSFLVNIFKPDFVIIDNIGDFCKDSNNTQFSAELADAVDKISKHNNCHCIVVLHQSESAEDVKALGTLGRDLMHKSGLQINLSKADGCNMPTKVIFSKTRDEDVPEWQFTVEKDESGLGIPVILESTNLEPKTQSDKNKLKVINKLTEWFENDAELKTNIFVGKICSLLKCETRTAENILTDLKKEQYIINPRRGIYSLASTQDLFSKDNDEAQT